MVKLKNNLSLFLRMQSKKEHYSLYHTLKNDLVPSGFDRQIVTILFRFSFLPLPMKGDVAYETENP